VIERLRVTNHRGVEVPAVLGLAIAVAGAISTVTIALLSDDPVPAEGWIASGAALLVVAAGLVDDLAPPGPRGLRGHARALLHMHVSSGIVKVVVIVGSSAIAVGVIPSRTALARWAGIVLVAACANLWNGLDVRPARAVKFFYPAALAVLATPAIVVPFSPGVVLGAVIVLPWDAGERAMLGDAGANLLGFTAGLCLFHQLHGPAIVLAAVVAVTLNVLAETVTVSRVIDAIPPLRWYDRLGTPSREG
jgi:UDP-GlcNAc:undecaprenyl-phosphate/decaprenyl-phosphate GlcNAc-1-phosphate transferase